MQITGIKLNTQAPQKKVQNTGKVTQPKKPSTIKNVVKKPTTQKPVPKKEQKKPKQQITKKQQIKQQVKDQPKQVVQEKKQEKIFQQQVKKQQNVQPIIEQFQVLLRYNHYKEKFPTKNGILSFAPVEEKYCFGLVYKGNYLPVLRIYNAKDQIPPLTIGTAVQYSWKVQQNQVYGISITQDDEQEAKREKIVYKAPQKDILKKNNNRFDELTNQMKKMDIKQLGGDKHKQLLQQRDLQDILYN